MAATYLKACPSCGGLHVLFLVPVDFFEQHKLYQYTCPKTGRKVEMPAPDEYAEVVQSRPIGVVDVREVIGGA
jgi:hypothetical protein